MLPDFGQHEQSDCTAILLEVALLSLLQTTPEALNREAGPPFLQASDCICKNVSLKTIIFASE